MQTIPLFILVLSSSLIGFREYLLLRFFLTSQFPKKLPSSHSKTFGLLVHIMSPPSRISLPPRFFPCWAFSHFGRCGIPPREFTLDLQQLRLFLVLCWHRFPSFKTDDVFSKTSLFNLVADYFRSPPPATHLSSVVVFFLSFFAGGGLPSLKKSLFSFPFLGYR